MIMKTKIEAFLSELNTEIDVLNFIDIESIDHNNAYDSIYDMVDNNGGFDIEIIYYSRAMEFLSENDPSLRESLELASEFGFTLDNLNSETLASLLASQNARNDFSDLENEINDFFENLEEEEEEEEE
jgi:hypothetical protein